MTQTTKIQVEVCSEVFNVVMFPLILTSYRKKMRGLNCHKEK